MYISIYLSMYDIYIYMCIHIYIYIYTCACSLGHAGVPEAPGSEAASSRAQA